MTYRVSATRRLTDADLRHLDPSVCLAFFRNRVAVTNDGRLRVNAGTIVQWLQRNCTGLYVVREADMEEITPFSVAFEKDEDLVMFTLAFEGAEPAALRNA